MALISRKLLQVRPQQLGRIKIGGLGATKTSKGGREYQVPVKYDHFVVTTNVRGDDGNFERDEVIHALIGEKPTKLSGLLMYPTVEENLHTEMCRYEGRGSKGKVWTCDGENATNLKTGKSGACIRLEGKDCECKPYTRFHMQLAGAPAMGYHFFRSTSWESTNNIQTALEEIYARFGTCFHAPVKLVCYPSEDEHDGQISTSTKVGLVLDMSMEEAAELIGRGSRYLEIASGSVKQIAAVVQEDLAAQDEAEEKEITDEFFPPDATEVHVEQITDALDARDEASEDDPLEDGEPDKEEPDGEDQEEMVL